MENISGAILYLVVFFAIIYFLMIRPQQKHQKKRKELLENIKVNDKVITIGGIHGTITKIEEDKVYLRVADKVELVVTKHGIGQMVDE
ncbi:MAG: preprotein translocase subunit YajC [Clostridia bacterium]|nr:preprotein translocase subunit YajC [Clostridia bacterium]